VVGIDLAYGMTAFAQQSNDNPSNLHQSPHYVCANAAGLPLASHSIDVIFSNLTLQWCYPLSDVIHEIYRVAKPGADIFLSTLGPQTLYELRESFKAVDDHVHVNDFCDLITVGNALQGAGWIEPVVDREIITLTYKNVLSLFNMLKTTGTHNKHNHRAKGCTSAQRLQKAIQAYAQFKNADGLHPATFEVIYGHAKKPLQPLYRQDEHGIIRVPGDRIPRLNQMLTKAIVVPIT